MNIMNKKKSFWEERSEKYSKSIQSPLSDNVINSCIISKYYKPDKFYPYFKEIIKRLINYPTAIPKLYYDHDIDFAFFPRPSKKVLDNLYGDLNTNKKIDLDAEVENAKSKTRNSDAYFMYKWIEAEAKKINYNIKNVLDFGAGAGWFSLAMSNLKLQVTATDIFQEIMKVIPLLDKKIKVTPYESLGTKPQYDLIVSFDVFEHLANPVSELCMLNKKLNHDGLMFISVPNFASYFSKINLGKHPYFEYPSHLNYFTRKSLRFLCKRAGMKVLRCETITLNWEIEYIRMFYKKDEVKLKGYQLFDKWVEPENGERLLCIAQKTDKEILI